MDDLKFGGQRLACERGIGGLLRNWKTVNPSGFSQIAHHDTNSSAVPARKEGKANVGAKNF